MKNESNKHQILLTLRRSSARMQPTAQISTPVPYILAPNNSSGDLYHLRPEEILLQFLAYHSILSNKHFLSNDKNNIGFALVTRKGKNVTPLADETTEHFLELLVPLKKFNVAN